ncbi:hypothetical protein HHX47_DHR2000107 [Lentinula edodes]|nr:hypothetical protein HHX47_DHR2000107 [Lentinula edodes]
MGRRKNRGRDPVLLFLQDSHNLRILAQLANEDNFDSDIAAGLLKDVQNKVSNVPDWETFYKRATRVSSSLSDQKPITHLRQFLSHVRARNTQNTAKASHRQKRKLVSELGIRSDPYTVQDVLDGKPNAPKFIVIWRERTTKYRDIKANIYMTENASSENHGVLKVVDLDDYDMLRLDHDKSYIILSGCPKAFIIQSVVMRGVALGCAYSPCLTEFLREAVDAAVNFRRNIRPTHVGTMNQVGLNMGPRHARVFGPAVSFTKKLVKEKMVDHDEDIIGAASLIWSIAQAVLPQDVLQVMYDHIAAEELPLLQTRNVAPGSGFTLQIDSTEYFFPYTERAPPEVYINRAYSAPTHMDRTYWSSCTPL